MVDFESLLDGNEEAVLDPRDIFLTLDRDAAFAFPRDIQTEVMKAWFATRNQADTIIKLNVGSGKTFVGLLLLQSSLNEEHGPALYLCPDKQLVTQVVDEAKLLGLEVTEDPKDPAFASGEKICVTTIHKVFNGKSVFGIGNVKLNIGTVVVDDAHACIATIEKQFQIKLLNTHSAYSKIFGLVSNDLKKQSHSKFLDLAASDPQAVMEVPFWSWQEHHDGILKILHDHKDEDDLLFSYSLLCDVLTQCRCIIGGQHLEIEPVCPPTDLIRAFSRAKRRIYMTATLSDDSVLVTHFGANPDKLSAPIVPDSSQSMGERMILMPQELNPEIDVVSIKKLLLKLSEDENVVVIVPSKTASDGWKDEADQILIGSNVVAGIDKLRDGHVGLTVLVNRYDGIDLPGDACRVLAIFDLPEVVSFREASDMNVLSNSDSALKRQIQRIEQGMGRGVRSNDDYCVVLLCGAKLTSRLKSPNGKAMLTGATLAQLDLSTNLAKQMDGTNIEGINDVIRHCLDRDAGWTKVSKKSLLRVTQEKDLVLDPISVSLRSAFDHTKSGDHTSALAILDRAENSTTDSDLRAWLKVRKAEITQHVDPAEAQKILLSAYRLNPTVLRPIEGMAYQKLSPIAGQQAAEVQNYHRQRFLEAGDRILYVKGLLEDLQFSPDTSNVFEAAIREIAILIGLGSQRPEKEFGKGPDNLWAFSANAFLVIECKNGATSEMGISKTDLGQLGQAIDWFKDKYTNAAQATPIMIHPLCTVGVGGTKVAGMRVITEENLSKLRNALEQFAKALGDDNIINDTSRIANLLNEHSFIPNKLVDTYTSNIRG